MSDLVTDGCEPPCGCWDLNSGPLDEQSVLLTTEQSLQHSVVVVKDLFIIIHKYTVAVFRHQKRVTDLITDGCEPPCGWWDLSSGPLEEQSVLLTAEPSLEPPGYLFKP